MPGGCVLAQRNEKFLTPGYQAQHFTHTYTKTPQSKKILNLYIHCHAEVGTIL